MALTERIDYIMQADATGLMRTLGKTSQALAQTGTDATASTAKIQSTHASVAQRLTGMGDKLVGVGKTMTAAITLPAVGAFLALGTSAANAAREHERLALNLKGSAKATDEQVDASEAFLRKIAFTTGVMKGETRPALSQLASATKDTAKAQDLLTLAVDISAAKGKPLEQVAMALSRAYNGNTGALGRMGVATKDASGKTKDFATLQAELQGQVGGTAEALGKTSAGAYDIAKAKMTTLKAEIAGKMLPAFTAFTDKIVGVVDWLSRMPQGLQQAAIGLVAVAAAAGPLTTIFGGILKGGGAIVTAFANMGAGAVTAGDGVSKLAARWQTFLNAAPWMIAAAGVATAAGIMYKAYQEVNRSWDELKDKAQTFTQRLNLQRQAVTDLNAAADEASRGGLAGISSLWESDAADKANREMFDSNMRFLDSVLEVKRATGLTREEITKLAQANKVDLSDGTAESRDKLIQLAVGTGQAKNGLAQMSEQTTRTARDVDDLKEAMDDLLGPFLSAEQANASYQRSLHEVDTKLNETVAQFGRGQLGVSQLRGNVADLVNDWQRNYDAMARNGATAAQLGAAKEELRGKLGLLAQRFPELAGTVQGYTDRLNAVPTHIDTQATVDTSQAMAALGELIAKMAEVAADPNSSVWKTKVTGTGKVAGVFKGVWRAAGGSVAPGTPTLVGERGPEVVRFASAATVYPSDSPPGLAGAGGDVTVVLNVAGSVLTDDDLARRIEEGLARTKRRSGSLAFL